MNGRRRYGKGQVLLLEDSGLLLIAVEDGQVVLLRALCPVQLFRGPVQ